MMDHRRRPRHGSGALRPTDDHLIVTTVGGPTALLELAGLRILTDPTFDGPGDFPMGGGYSLVKEHGPAVAAAQIGPIDIVLLSHDQHPDNLDNAGRLVLPEAAVVLTTQAAAERLVAPNVVGLAPWTVHIARSPRGPQVHVTALPAQHGPDRGHELLGPVIGFRLDADDQPSVYFSGDNASLAVVTEIRERTGPVDIAILCVGGARTPRLGAAFLTLNSSDAARAADILQASDVVAVHCDGWKHFTEGPEVIAEAFARSRSRIAPHTHGAPHRLSGDH